MDIRPLRTEEDYEWALAEIDRLFDAEPNTPEADKLEILVILVEAYEEENHPAPMPDPVEAIKYWMEARNLDRADLEPYIGSRGRVTEILNRKRPLTLRMIRNLERGLGIPAEVLVQAYPLSETVGALASNPDQILESPRLDYSNPRAERERVVIAERFGREDLSRYRYRHSETHADVFHDNVVKEESRVSDVSTTENTAIYPIEESADRQRIKVYKIVEDFFASGER
jgi:HTH-type transcriptional regulator/antitoxin HigA